MYPRATSVLESSWLGVLLVEFNTVVNRAVSWDGNKRNNVLKAEQPVQTVLVHSAAK